jgi:hypothetical protein
MGLLRRLPVVKFTLDLRSYDRPPGHDDTAAPVDKGLAVFCGEEADRQHQSGRTQELAKHVFY